MKILVTGSTGFIGSYLVEELLNQGHQIIATSFIASKAFNKAWFKKVEYIPYEISTTITKNDLFEFFKCPDLVIHLAWEGLPNYNDLIHIEKNLFSQYHFLNNLISNGLKKLVVTGTCMEYGMQNGCMYENSNTNPQNSYAIAKDTLRKFIDILSDKFNLDFKWIRLFYMYGKGQSSSSLFSQLDNAIANHDSEFKMSPGDQLRDFLTVETVVKNIAKIALQDKHNGIFNCSSNEPKSVRRLVEEYLESKKVNIKLNLGYYNYSTLEPLSFWGDNTKLKKCIDE